MTENPIAALLSTACHTHANQLAVIDTKRSWSYQAIAERIKKLALVLQQQGVAPGDRVAVLLDNRAEYFEAYFALPSIAAIIVPLNIRLSAAEIRHILHDAGAKVIICDAIFRKLLQSAIAPISDGKKIIWLGERTCDDTMVNLSYEALLASVDGKNFSPISLSSSSVAQLYYTSGTTGMPKGVMLTHANIVQHALCASRVLALCTNDRWGHFAPLFHLADAWAIFAITHAGGVHVMQRRFHADTTLQTIQTQRITVTNLVPTMLNQMIKSSGLSNYDLSSMRLVMSGGASIAPCMVEQIITIFQCEYVQTYGMTETSPFLTLSLLTDKLRTLSWPKQLAFKAKTGRAFPIITLRVIDDKGQDIAADDKTVGEILVKGPTVTPGYWKNPQASAQAFTPDGWLKTGDLATIDQEGFVNIVDRRKDMIITGGENVYCAEVEAALYSHPFVHEAAVFGQPDRKWGEMVVAAIVLKAPIEPSTDTIHNLLNACREHIAGYKVPKAVIFLDSLPKTASGKIMKKRLRELAPLLILDQQKATTMPRNITAAK